MWVGGASCLPLRAGEHPLCRGVSPVYALLLFLLISLCLFCSCYDSTSVIASDSCVKWETGGTGDCVGRQLQRGMSIPSRLYGAFTHAHTHTAVSCGFCFIFACSLADGHDVLSLFAKHHCWGCIASFCTPLWCTWCISSVLFLVLDVPIVCLYVYIDVYVCVCVCVGACPLVTLMVAPIHAISVDLFFPYWNNVKCGAHLLCVCEEQTACCLKLRVCT